MTERKLYYRLLPLNIGRERRLLSGGGRRCVTRDAESVALFGSVVFFRLFSCLFLGYSVCVQWIEKVVELGFKY